MHRCQRALQQLPGARSRAAVTATRPLRLRLRHHAAGAPAAALRPRAPPALGAPRRRHFASTGSFIFGGDAPPDAVQTDWEAGLELTKGGKAAEAEVAFQRALTGIEGAGYAPSSGQGRATVAAMWRDLARVQSMQGRAHEALHNLRRSLAVYDGIDQGAELLDVAEHWAKQSGVTGKLAKELPRMPDGVPVDLLLNILDNVVSHCVKLHGDAEPFVRARIALLERAQTVREFHKMDASTTREEKAVALYKSGKIDEAIAELRRGLADAPDLPFDPEIAPVLRRVTAQRTLAAWLAERAAGGSPLADGDRDEGTRLYERSLELVDVVFPEDEEDELLENPDFKPKEQSLADALRMEVTRVRFALLLQLMRLQAGNKDVERVEEHGGRLFDKEFLAKAEKMGVADGTEEFTDARKAWRVGLFRVGAEAFTRAGSQKAVQRWRDVVEICKERERDVHMQMGIARPTQDMRGQTADALLGQAAALHPPWKRLPLGVKIEDGDTGEHTFDREKLQSSVDEIEAALREALQIIEEVPGTTSEGATELAHLKALGSVMLARALRLPVAVGEQSAGRGIGFLSRYPGRAREYAKLIHAGVACATSVLGEIPQLPDGSALGSDEAEEDFGDERDWRELGEAERSAATRLGWFEETWDEGAWLDEYSSECCVSWAELSGEARVDAELLGYDQGEWDCCFNDDEDDEPEQVEPLRNERHAAVWEALHGAVAGGGAALAGLPAGQRRTVELSVDLALEELLMIATDMGEEEAMVNHELQEASGGGELDAMGKKVLADRAEVKARWWGQLAPGVAALAPAVAQVHGGRCEALATTLSLLGKVKEETGQVGGALQLYQRVGAESWDTPGGSMQQRAIQLGGKFELGRLHAGDVEGDGVERAERVFRMEFDALVSGDDGDVDLQMVAVFGSGLEAVLRAQGRAGEADAVAAQAAQAMSDGL